MQDDLWGDNNQWAVNMEQELCAMLLIRFTGLKANGQRQRRKTKGNCFHTIFVRAKNSQITEKCRYYTRKHHRVAIYCRSEKKNFKVDPVTKAKDPSSLKKGELPAVRVRLEATVASLGFNGIYALCDGHPDLEL